MMRVPVLAALSAALLTAGCSVQLEGAPCETDENCPNGQYCTEALTCANGTNPGGGGDGGRDGGGTDAGGDAGFECPASGCVVGTDTTCGTDGTLVTCAADVNGCGVFAETGGVTCAAPTVCTKTEGTAACDCPEPGTELGQSCTDTTARECREGVVVACVADQGCAVWTATTDCAALGLTCSSTSGAARCDCPARPLDRVYANPVKGNDPGGDVAVNGTDANPACQYRHLTDALAAAPKGATIVLSGFPRFPTWTHGTPYAAGDRVMAGTRTGLHYEAMNAGTSGATEPAKWPALGEIIQDGTVTWRAAGLDWVAFDDEPAYPVTVPTSRALRGECFPADAGSDAGEDCDLTRYAVMTSGPAAANATAAVKLEASSTLYNLTVAAGDAGTTASGVLCDDSSVTVAAVLAYGDTQQGGSLAKGFKIAGTCQFTGIGTAAYLIDGPGVQLDSTAIQESLIAYSDFGPKEVDSTAGNRIGIEVKNGILTGDNIGVGGSVEQGLLVTGPSSKVSISNLRATNNGRASVTASRSGVHVVAGTVSLEDLFASGNGRSGIQVEGGAVSLTAATASVRNTLTQNGATAVGTALVRPAGVEVTGGSLTGSAVDSEANFGSGVVVSGAGKANINGVNARANEQQGVAVHAGTNPTLQLVNADISNNDSYGVLVEAGAFQLSGTGSISNNGNAKTASGVAVTGGTVDIGDLNAPLISISGNATAGVQVTGGQVYLTGVVIENHQKVAEGNGVLLFGPTAKVTLTDSKVQGNVENGVVVVGGAVTAISTAISGNSKSGVVLTSYMGVTGGRAATLDGCVISNNGGFGVLNVDPLQSKQSASLTLQGSDIYSNATALLATQKPAGISMMAPAVLKYVNNRVYGNRGHQLSFTAAPQLTSAWNISQSACNSAAQSAIYCYGPSPAVGVMAGPGVTVIAHNLSWANASPTLMTDYVGNVATSPSCAPPTTPCPP